MDQIFSLKKRREDLTFADLREHFSTGRAYIKSGTGRDRVYGYRHGVMTDLGDIEESEWSELLLELIRRSGEVELHEQLRRWARDRCAWLHSKQEVERYALQLHSSRIFDNPEWADYELFNSEYRPQMVGEG